MSGSSFCRRSCSFATLTFAALAGLACAGSPSKQQSQAQIIQRTTRPVGGVLTADSSLPPPSGEVRDITFPPIVRHKLANGLEINTVERRDLPLVILRLVIRSGGEVDPAKQPGLSKLVASMLEEGTKRRSSAQLAEEVEFLGASWSVGSDEENLTISMQLLSRDLPAMLEILADVVQHPAFRSDELDKLKQRELDRLRLREQDPGFVAAREMFRRLYGEHPYARIDTTAEVVQQVKQKDLRAWHKRYVLPNNAFLVAVGDVDAATLQEASAQALKGWKKGKLMLPSYPGLPQESASQVVIVDRPGSVQSNIVVGNLALARNDAAYVPLVVANQVLGGSAASRLFMDLRERRSLTYGAYSSVGQSVQPAPFRASAAVRTEVTVEALQAFFEHLQRISSQPATAAELKNAKQYLSDRFPLQIDTAGKIASLVSDLRIYDLPDDYWESYRSQLRGISIEQALDAARSYIRPDKAWVVVVGDAASIEPSLRKDKHFRGKPIEVVDLQGKPRTAAGAAP